MVPSFNTVVTYIGKTQAKLHTLNSANVVCTTVLCDNRKYVIITVINIILIVIVNFSAL